MPSGAATLPVTTKHVAPLCSNPWKELPRPNRGAVPGDVDGSRRPQFPKGQNSVRLDERWDLIRPTGVTKVLFRADNLSLHSLVA